jgi:negative regulator of replication initiation
VRDHSAFEDAQSDYRDAAGHREAATTLPRAWDELVGEANELVLEALSDKAEALCGFKPASSDVIIFLRRLKVGQEPAPTSGRQQKPAKDAQLAAINSVPGATEDLSAASDRTIRFKLFGEERVCPNAGHALVEVLRVLASRDPAKIPELAEAVKGRTRNLIARSVAEINPGRPDLARAAEFSPGWLIGLNISNRDKMAIVRTACTLFGVRLPEDLEITLPNAP